MSSRATCPRPSGGSAAARPSRRLAVLRHWRCWPGCAGMSGMRLAAAGTRLRGSAGGPPPTRRATARGLPTIAGCPVFPADNPWNRDVSRRSRRPALRRLHREHRGEHVPPPGLRQRPHLRHPLDERAGDAAARAHVLRLRRRERPRAVPVPAGCAGGGRRRPPRPRRRPRRLPALRDVRLALRGTGMARADRARCSTCARTRCGPDGWTSADAAGLPILPGLVRREEVLAGEIRHALRFTVAADAARLRPPGHALREQQHRPQPAAHGPARAAQGLLRRVALLGPGARDPHRPRALRDVRGRQRLATGSSAGRRTPPGTTTSWSQLKTVPGSAFEVVRLGRFADSCSAEAWKRE